MSELVYSLRNVTQEYAGRRVLQIERLDVHRGEVLALVGPSGAGKSTLLRLLNFLETPTSGSIRFLGAEYGAGQTPPVEMRRRVTTVFQRPMLLNRSVKSNVAFGLRLRGQRNSSAWIASTLARVGLEPLAGQRAHTLSGGEAQRVALARAMVLRPDVLLLDEPTANLDPYNVGLIEDIVRDLNGQRQTTLVLVTHNVFQARRLAGRVVLMLEGRIVEVAGVDDFFQAPRDARTAAFVRGEMVY
jgi:tungstate transport system ATP-binding protein